VESRLVWPNRAKSNCTDSKQARCSNPGLRPYTSLRKGDQNGLEAPAPPAQPVPGPDWRLAGNPGENQKRENERYFALPTYLPTYLPRVASLALLMIVAGSKAEATYIIKIA